MKESRIVQALDRRLYPGVVANWDDELLRHRIASHLRPSMDVLDLGAGAGIVRQMNFKGMARRVCGVDMDPRVIGNPFLHEAVIGSAEDIPHGADTFDLVFSDNVLEHLQNPEAAFREIRRVLKCGGRFLAKTPNKWHYMPLVARVTPHAFHTFYNRMRGRLASDTFPTFYRANSRKCLRSIAQSAGLEVVRMELVECRPEYMRISAPTYLLGAAYERVVNCWEGFSGMRILIIAEFRKPL